MEISKEEFQAWKDSKVTQAVLETLVQRREAFKEMLANGGTLAEDAPKGATAMTVGRIQGINEILLVEYEEPEQEYNH